MQNSSFLKSAAGIAAFALAVPGLLSDRLSALEKSPGSAAVTASASQSAADASAPEPDASPSAGQPAGRNTWLGLAVTEAPQEVTAQLPVEAGTGLLVEDVVPGSPAEKAGLRRHDVLVKFDDHVLAHEAQLSRLVRNRAPGDRVRITFYRQGRQETVTAELAAGGAESATRRMPSLGRWHGDRNRFDAAKFRRELERILKDSGIDRKRLDEWDRRIERALRDAGVDAVITWPGGISTTTRILTERGNRSTLIDDSGTYIVSEKDGHQTLRAFDHDGNVLFRGEVDTETQRKAVPPEILDKVRGMLGNPKPE